MPAKKDTTPQLSPEESSQVQHLLSNYAQLAAQIHTSNDRAQAEMVMKDLFEASEPVQSALLKALARTREQDAADLLIAVNALSPRKDIRKEARRALIQLESAKIYPQWTPPDARATAVQINVTNPPRFLKGLATQIREEGEMQLILCWEQGYNYEEVRMFSFLLDFWQDGVKDFYVETGTRRKIDEHINELRSLRAQFPLVPCTLTEGKQLLTEALSVNAWHNTTPSSEYQMQSPLINNLILEAETTDQDSGQTFITPELEIQEVVVNYIGAWSFGDFGLAYDLLTSQSPVRGKLARDEWIEQHRRWFDEAHPTRMELGFVHEREQTQSSTLWVPASVITRLDSSKGIEVGWSLELTDTQLNGTISEMPMGTAVNKETGRHWFWTNFTMVKEQNVWRIQQIKDEGTALQGLSIAELQKRIQENENAIEQRIKQRDLQPEAFMEEMSWRLTQALHHYDALIAQLPLDYTVLNDAYGRAVLTGNPERMIVYLDRLQQRFPQNKINTLCQLGSTLAELAFRYEGTDLKARKKHLLTRAEETLREAIALDDSATNHSLLGELLMSMDRLEEAQVEFLKA